MRKVGWDATVPSVVDCWSWFKATTLFGLDLDEKSSLIVTMFVPPARSHYGGDDVYDY